MPGRPPTGTTITGDMPSRDLPVLDIAPPVAPPAGLRETLAPQDERLTEFRPEPRSLPSFFVWTLGCQMNKSDSEEMAGRLLAAGCAEAPAMDAADLVVINTCAIRESAEAKVVGRQGHLGRLKAANPGMRVVMTGCSVRESNRAGLARRYPAVDLFLRPDEEPELVDRLGLASAQAPVGALAATAATRPREGRAGLRCHASRPRARRGGRGRRGEPRLGDQRLAPDHLRLRQDLHLLHRPVQPGPGAQPAVRRDRRRGAGSRGPRFPRGHPPRPERQQLRPRPAGRGAVRPRQHDANRGSPPGPRGAPGPGGACPRHRRPANGRWHLRDPAPAVRDVAPVGPLGPPGRGTCGLPQRLRVAPPSRPVRLGLDAPAHGPPVHDRALPRALGPDPGGRARHLALDRRDRGLLRRDRGRVRGHARPPAHGPLRPGLRGGLQRAARHPGHQASPTTSRPRRSDGASSGCSASRSGSASSATAPGTGAPPRCSWTGSCRPGPTTTTTRRPRGPPSHATPSPGSRRVSSTSSGDRARTSSSTSPARPRSSATLVDVRVEHAGAYALRGTRVMAAAD